MTHALVDTSVFIARESGRAFNESSIPDDLAVSIVTVGELRAGVLAAGDIRVRDRRLATLIAALEFDPVPIDDEVAAQWARLRVLLRDAGQRMPVNDSWIAATAMALEVPVVAQDGDYVEVDGLSVIRI